MTMKIMRKSSVFMGLLLSSAIVFSACTKEKVEAPALNSNAAAMQASPAAGKGDMTIGQIAAANGNFTQLVDALTYTGLLDIFLSGSDQYTVFAPNDDAFEALYTALNISDIRDLDVDLVKNVLLYHVTDGRRFSNSVVPKSNVRRIETLLDKPFYVNSGGGIDTNDADMNSNATILLPNLSASNGVIHVINSVLIPE